jgi:adenosylcobyric acid synthase
LNKFRGDPALLDPAPAELERMTGVPMLGLVPWLKHQLPDEDGGAPVAAGPAVGTQTVAVIRYPTASNLDEFKPLEGVARLRWAWDPFGLEDADLVILPGSKYVAGDLAWLRERGFEDALKRRVTEGRRILAICGGLQMLGGRIEDPAAVEADAVGLGILPLVTSLGREKIVRSVKAQFALLSDPWIALSGISFKGYEIRHGRSVPGPLLTEAVEDGLGYVEGPILASHVHGMFEAPKVLEALFGLAGQGGLEDTLDALTDALEPCLEMAKIEGLVAARRSMTYRRRSPDF